MCHLFQVSQKVVHRHVNFALLIVDIDIFSGGACCLSLERSGDVRRRRRHTSEGGGGGGEMASSNYYS